MKRIFYFAIAAFAATAVMVSCEKDEPKDPNGGGNGNEDDPTKTEKLAAPANFNGTVNGDDLTITWDAVENAVSYSYVVDNSEPATVTEPSVTLSVEALGYGDHTIFVTALPEDGSEQYTASDEASFKFSLSEPVPMPDEYADYVGTWNVTTTKTLVAATTQGESDRIDETPMTIENVSIAWSETEGALLMTGFTAFETVLGSSIPAYIVPDEAGVLNIAGVQLNFDLGELDPNFSGYMTTWCPMYMTEEGLGVAFSQGGMIPAYALTMSEDGNTITADGVDLQFSDGSTHTVEAYDLVGLSSQYYTLLNANSPAGTLTFTKTGDNAPALATSVSPLLPVTMTLTSNALSSMMASPIAR